MCVILCTKIKGKQILAKNRDRTYKPNIEIIHEIINGAMHRKDKDIFLKNTTFVYQTTRGTWKYTDIQ
jgi:hypothetical protein